MKIVSVIVLALGFAFNASATPGDQLCKAELNGQKVELLLGWDNHVQTSPSLILITVDNQQVFTNASAVTESMEKVAEVEGAPFYNKVLSANDEESSVKVRYPEQDATDEVNFTVFLTVTTDSGLFTATDLEMTCEY